MADMSYAIEAVLKMTGGQQFGAEANQAAKSAESLQSALDKIGGGAKEAGRGLVDLASKAVDTGAKIAAAFAAAGLAAGALVTSKTFGAISVLEDKSIQLGATLAASMQRPFEEARVDANKLFEQFRVDAIKSAGETADFVNVAGMIAGPITGAGKSMKELHDMTQAVMNAAPVMGVSFEQAGADVMRMLQGMAGAHEPLFRMMSSMPSLGIKNAEAFNKMSAAARFDAVFKALGNDAFAKGAEAAGASWTGLKSTLQDVAKNVLIIAGTPLFEHAKARLSAFNEKALEGLGPDGFLRRGFTTVALTIEARLQQIEHAIGRFFPDVEGQAHDTIAMINRVVDSTLGGIATGIDFVADHWQGLTDGARAFARWVETALDRVERLARAVGGGDLEKGVERLALLYGGGKLAAPMLPGLAQMGGGLFDLGKAALARGGGAAAAEAVAMPSVEEAFGAASRTGLRGAMNAAGPEGAAALFFGGGSAAELGGGAAAAAGGVGATAGAAAAALVSAAAAFDLLRSPTLGVADNLKKAYDALAPLGYSLGSLWESLVNLWHALSPVITLLEIIIAIPIAPFILVVAGLSAALPYAIEAVDYLAQVLRYVANAATSAAHATSDFITGLLVKLGLKAPALEASEDTSSRPEMDVSGMNMVGVGATVGTNAAHAGSTSKAPKGGGGKIEVVLKWDLGDGNEDAIFVKTRRDIGKALKEIRAVPTMQRVRGAF